MLDFVEIISKKSKYYKEAQKLYTDFFLPQYRREDILEKCLDSRFQVKAILNDGLFIGFVSWWNFDSFIHGEHLLITPQLANKGYELKAFEYLAKNNKLITFEAMPLDLGEWPKIKMQIYKQFGFKENNFVYMQPPFKKNKPWAECIFMSYPRQLDSFEKEPILKTLYEEVYGISYLKAIQYLSNTAEYVSIVNGKKEYTNNYVFTKNPTTKEIIAKAYYADNKIIEKAVDSAKEAFKTWSKTTIKERVEIVRKVAEQLYENQGNMGDLKLSKAMNLIISEMGKSIHEAEIEIFESADFINYFCDIAEKTLQNEPLTLNSPDWADKKSFIEHTPIGVVAIIKPWNYPLELPLWSIVPAILAGNTVVFKPSEYTTGCGCYIYQLFENAGLPKGVLNLIVGNHNQGRKIVASDIDMVSFQGSSKAGQEIAVKCAKKQIKCVLELGGKDAAIVTEDCDIERAVNGVMFGAFCNAGQVCVASELVYVNEKIYDEFVEKLLSKVKSLNIGSGLNPDSDIVSISSNMQIQKIRKHVQDAIDKGANVLYGGKQLTKGQYKYGLYFLPTIITNINKNMLVYKEESFGPIIPIIKFSDYDLLIEEINSSKYGLSCSIWSKNEQKSLCLAKQINVGMVWVNDVNVAFAEAPWGGNKCSGKGRELGKEGLLEYTNTKHINTEFTKNTTQPWWYPYKK